MDIAEFLLARVAEDEAVAREAASTGGWPEDPARPMQDTWHTTEAEPQPDSDGRWWPTQIRSGTWVIAGGRGNEDDGVDGHVARHIARWDPARVLAECEAKRRIVLLWQIWNTPESRGPNRGHLRTDPYAEGARHIGLVALHQLAMPYADHPDYQPEWNPMATTS